MSSAVPKMCSVQLWRTKSPGPYYPIPSHFQGFLASSSMSSWALHFLKSSKVLSALVPSVFKDAWNSVYTEVRLQLRPLLSPRFLQSKSTSHACSPTGTAKKIGVWGIFLIVLEFFKGLLGKDSKNGIVEFCLFLVFRRSSQLATKADTEGKK